jgi:hypothetical protein
MNALRYSTKYVITLLTVTVLFLFTFFNLILDAHRLLASAVQYVTRLNTHDKNHRVKNLHIKAGTDNYITLLNTYFQALPSYNKILQFRLSPHYYAKFQLS